MDIFIKNISIYGGFAGFILWAVIERAFFMQNQQQESGRGDDRASYTLISACWYAAVIYSLLDAWNFNWSLLPQKLWMLPAAGLLLTAGGLCIRFLSRRTLGRHYSVRVETSQAHRLVTTGMYRYVRHPAYLGLLCLFFGIPLCEGSWGGLLLAALGGLPSILYRIQIEEKALNQWFGEEYRYYSQNSWRLIPYIW